MRKDTKVVTGLFAIAAVVGIICSLIYIVKWIKLGGWALAISLWGQIGWGYSIGLMAILVVVVALAIWCCALWERDAKAAERA